MEAERGRLAKGISSGTLRATEYDDEPAALRFVQEPYRARIIADAQERGGVADIAVGFDELRVRFGDGSEGRYV